MFSVEFWQGQQGRQENDEQTAWSVSTYHGEGKTLHYVVDGNGDPVESYPTRDQALRVAASKRIEPRERP